MPDYLKEVEIFGQMKRLHKGDKLFGTAWQSASKQRLSITLSEYDNVINILNFRARAQVVEATQRKERKK